MVGPEAGGSPRVLLVGASVRAAAFSALRAGLSPWCADLFADVDLVAVCPTQRLTSNYPDGFADLLAAAPGGPWLYTGGLENHPRLVKRLARARTLWGNDIGALEACRDPVFVARVLHDAGLPAPALCPMGALPSPQRRWLVKRLRGAGGAGVRFHEGGPAPRGHVLQEYVEGESAAALFVGAGPATAFLGLTRQLVGEDWLNASSFHYCGSIGPLPLTPVQTEQLERLGRALAVGCGLIGVFGVDGIVRAGEFWPVEVNPRYTASVEVLEHALGLAALEWHRRACVGPWPAPAVPAAGAVVGKVILFAQDTLVFPAEGPWVGVLRSPPDAWQLPTHADIPAAGTVIRAHQPILTVLARGPTAKMVATTLRQRAEQVRASLSLS